MNDNPDKQSSGTFASFHLDKWYLDCVTEEGDSAICYSATLAWKQVSFSYASTLTFDKNGPQQKTSLLNAKQPEQTPEGLVWQSTGLKCRGLWRPAANALDSITLYESEAASVRWHCIQPLSLVGLTIGKALYTGLGYAERLEMTVAPWKLPIDELRWGRFLSDDVYVVWLQWRGTSPLTRLYFNGEIAENVEISPNRVCWDRGHLIISDNVTLREGPIISTALSRVPVLGSLVPDTFRESYESKWRGVGELKLEDSLHKGWVIHEIVRFR